MNNLIFNGTASQLQVQISGVNGSDVTAIAVDENGNMQVVGTVTVNAATVTVQGGSITVQGGSITVQGGTITVQGGSIDLDGRAVTESSEALDNVDTAGTAMTETTSEFNMFTYYLTNLGDASMTVKLQIAPVNAETYFVDDPAGATVLGASNEDNNIVTLVAQRYMKYTRLYYDPAAAATASVHFIGQV